MSKFLSYILTPIFYLFFGLSLAIFHPLQWICYRIFGYKAHKISVDLLNFCLTHCQWLLLNTTTFINNQDLPKNRPIIFVANHQSLYDIPALIWFLRAHHVKFISKIELTKGIPSISFNLKYGGGANIDRKDSKQAVAEIVKLGHRMKDNNWAAVIFAEGTRARDGKLKPFQVGGIATLLKVVPHALIVPVAIENSWKIVKWGSFPLGFLVPHALIVPVAIENSWKIVKWGSFPLGSCLKLKWTVLPPIKTEGLNAEEITLEAEKTIRLVLEEKS